LEVEPFAPPTDSRLEPELLAALVDDGRVVKVNEDVVFAASAYRQMVERIVELARKQGKVSVADVRTLFNSSRKYVLPLLEYLDSQRITRRVGDERVLRQG
jgi:selenocysteine-specific elongation factor